jgi:hypothetical protein
MRTNLSSRRGYSWLLWSLTAMFALRVVGQALQLWRPQSYLPDFANFQGSNLPYAVLLCSQLLILGAMTSVSRQVQRGRLRPRFQVGRALAWGGGIYLTVSVARLVVGQMVTTAPAWFKVWIPAVFHVVLATFVLVVAGYHLRGSARPG